MTKSKSRSAAIRLAILPFLLSTLSAFSQKEANNWYFGHMGGMSFANGAPEKLTDGAIDAFEGCASYSDAAGNLLFYTNGGGSPPSVIFNGERQGIIWNRNHEVMYDMGTDEGGGYSAGQSALILPVPGSDHEYYLFTMDQHPSLTAPQVNRGLSYFIIDMSLNGGLGGVTVANQPIFTPASECLSVALHENGSDYWLITVDRNTDDFVVVPVTAAGVQTPFPQPRGANDLGLIIKVSPDSKRLFHSYRLYDFDRATGAIALNTYLPQSSFYSFSFSPNSRYLYTVNGDLGEEMIRYDVTAPNIAASVQSIAYLGLSYPGGMQVGPDGHLYFCEQTEQIVIDALAGVSVIRCPNADVPTYVPTIFTFDTEPTIDVTVGLPNYPDFLFDQLFDTVEISFDTVSFCPGDEPALLEANYTGASYLWSTGETTADITAPTLGDYSVTITNLCGTEVVVRQFTVQSGETLVDEPDESLTICAGESALLSGPAGADTYAWSTGETTADLSVLQPGNYTVTATNGCASTVKNFVVTTLASPEVELVSGPLTGLCKTDTIELQALSADALSFVWSTGDTTANLLVPAGETYAVTATNACGTSSASLEVPISYCCTFEVPNAFSPNGDSVNDGFAPVTSDCEISNYRLRIFNRWGDLVFETADPAEAWDGKDGGKSASSDVFVYQMVYEVKTETGTIEQRKESGDLTLLY